MKYVVCYSGGHSSAICAVEVARKYGKENVILLNHDINERVEDIDIKRFKKEVADYLGIPITYANMVDWDKKDQFDICVELGTIFAGKPGKALCTNKLKTEPFHKWLSDNYPVEKGNIRNDICIVYGFDSNEIVRITRRAGIMLSMGYKTEFPFLWDNRTISNIEEIGITRPITYEIFNHANCIGCLKAGKQHWFIVYCLYPEIWEKAKKAELQIGYSILREKYLEDYEKDWSILKSKHFPTTEKINPQKFWAKARKILREDDILPCDCSF